MEYNFIRYCEIDVGGVVLNSNSYEIFFNVDRRKGNKQNLADITLNYVSQKTRDMFSKGKKIKIVAGYERGSTGLVFSGEIDKIEWNDKDGINAICTEENKIWTNEIVNKSFKSGETGIKLKEIVKNVISTSSIKHGEVDCDDYTYKRGLNLQGTLKSELTKLSKVVNAETYIKKNKIYFVRKDYSSLETIISADTGLLKIRKEDDGYVLEMMLNHRIEEDMILNVKGRDIQFKARVKSVSHKYDKRRFETVIETVEVK